MSEMTREQRWDKEQADYEERYFARMERDRPKPEHDMSALLALAREAAEDPAKLIVWQLAATPQNLLDAVAAQKWDNDNPFYNCRHCKDGASLPEGYQCQRCGADNPRGGF